MIRVYMGGVVAYVANLSNSVKVLEHPPPEMGAMSDVKILFRTHLLIRTYETKQIRASHRGW
jgi:hypothetical protein